MLCASHLCHFVFYLCLAALPPLSSLVPRTLVPFSLFHGGPASTLYSLFHFQNNSSPIFLPTCLYPCFPFMLPLDVTAFQCQAFYTLWAACPFECRHWHVLSTSACVTVSCGCVEDIPRSRVGHFSRKCVLYKLPCGFWLWRATLHILLKKAHFVWYQLTHNPAGEAYFSERHTVLLIL